MIRHRFVTISPAALERKPADSKAFRATPTAYWIAPAAERPCSQARLRPGALPRSSCARAARKLWFYGGRAIPRRRFLLVSHHITITGAPHLVAGFG